MGRMSIVGAVFFGLLGMVVADDARDESTSKSDAGTSLNALIKLADQIRVDETEPDRAPGRPARDIKDMPARKADERAGPDAKADRAREKQAEPNGNDMRPPRRVRDDRPGFAGNRQVNERGARANARRDPVAANRGFGPLGGFVLSPVPYQPVYYGVSGYGYGFNSFGLSGYNYGYSYWPYSPYYDPFFYSPVVTRMGPPVDVRYDNPQGRLREALLEGARRNAENPAGLFPGRSGSR
jgi:hypothetical protein